jgi:hypothetical protein
MGIKLKVEVGVQSLCMLAGCSVRELYAGVADARQQDGARMEEKSTKMRIAEGEGVGNKQLEERRVWLCGW